MTEHEQLLEQKAIEFARSHRKVLARRLTDPEVFPGEDCPVSVFMAGSPGAGKTEASIELVGKLEHEGARILRIDPDDLRHECPGYNGKNSWLFQKAISLLVEKIHDNALKQKQSFLLDGTLSSYAVAEKNIVRSIKKARPVQILYVFQEPRFAWKFVQARELKEGRNILPEHFVEKYFGSRETVEGLKRHFGREIKVDLLVKNLDGSRRQYFANVDQIESHIPENYSREEVLKIVKGG